MTSGAGCRRKGHSFERTIAAALRPLYGSAVRRGLQSRDGRDAPDVEGSPWWIECCHGARPNVGAKVRQAAAATDGRAIVVVTKRDRDPAGALVTMRLGDWLALVERAQRADA